MGLEGTRRGFITGLISLVAAPAIVRAGSLMPVKVMIEPTRIYWGFDAARTDGASMFRMGDGRFLIMVSPSQWRDITDNFGKALIR